MFCTCVSWLRTFFRRKGLWSTKLELLLSGFFIQTSVLLWKNSVFFFNIPHNKIIYQSSLLSTIFCNKEALRNSSTKFHQIQFCKYYQRNHFKRVLTFWILCFLVPFVAFLYHESVTTKLRKVMWECYVENSVSVQSDCTSYLHSIVSLLTLKTIQV